MASRAELRARLSLDKSLFDRGIASAQAGATRLAAGLAGAARIGARGMLFVGTAAIGLGAGIAIGTKHAFGLGSALKELSSRTGILPGKLLVLRQAFKDAGLEADDVGPSINRMQRFIENASEKGLKAFGINFAEIKKLKPEDQFAAIGKAIAGIGNQNEKVKAVMDIFGKQGGKLLDLFGDPKAMEDAAKSVGKQAEILNKNANLFDKISDTLNHAGNKLQGFFVGVAEGVSTSLAPVLDQLDSKLDFSTVGQKFGQALVTGTEALVGFFHNPSLLFDVATNYLKAGLLAAGNVLIAAFTSALEFLQNGFSAVLDGIGSEFTATLLEAFRKPIAYLQAGVQEATGVGGKGSQAGAKWQIGVQTFMRDLVGKDMSGNLNSLGKFYQKQIDEATKAMGKLPTFQDRVNKNLQEGPTFEGQTPAQIRDEGKRQLNEGLDKAAQAAKNFKVKDVLGAGDAFKAANSGFRKAAEEGAAMMPTMPPPPAPPPPAQWDRFAGFLGMSSAYGQSNQGASSPFAYTKHPDAYSKNPSAHDEVVSTIYNSGKGVEAKLDEHLQLTQDQGEEDY